MKALSVNARRQGGVAKLFRRLWDDDAGALLAVEWVVIATILVLGLIPGLIAVRQGVLSELVEFANAALGLNQSYSFSGQTVGCADAGTLGANGTVNNGLNTANVINRTTNNDNRLNGVPRTGVQANAQVRGGIQAFTAGSSAIEVHNADNVGKKLNLAATPATTNAINQPACD
jgi:Flp pilus assembly pilin Flp